MATDQSPMENSRFASSTLLAIAPKGVAIAEVHLPELSSRIRVQASAFRKYEFEAGRQCARQALAQLGVEVDRLERLADGRAAWPTGVIGSISHAEGYCCAVATEISMFSSIGVDAELICRADEDLIPIICTPREKQWLQRLPAERRKVGIALIFSAKESVYKCQYPITGRWLDFHDVSLQVNFNREINGVFSATVIDVEHPWHSKMPRICSTFGFNEKWVITIAACMNDNLKE